MTKAEILEFINENPIAFLATSDNNVPHVRAIRIVYANESGIYFSTWKLKDMHRHLTHNNTIELCFFSAMLNKQIRISGNVKHSNDETMKDDVIHKLPFLKTALQKLGRDALQIWHLEKGKACEWSVDKAFVPNEYIDF